MISYIIRRLLLMIPTLIGITLVVFFTMALAPGDRTQMMLGLEGDMSGDTDRDEQRNFVIKKYHLDEPLWKQYLIWMNGLSPIGWPEDAQGEFQEFGFKAPTFGESIQKRPVMDMILEALPITVVLNLLSFPLVYLISIWSGIQMGRRRGSLLDNGLGTFYLALYSLPVIWVGVLAVGYLASEQYPQLRYFPASGMGIEKSADMTFFPSYNNKGELEAGYLFFSLWHLILPVICMSYAGFAFLSKIMRTSILETISSDYVRTARAKGVGEKSVLYRHVFRNSLIPLITISAGIIPGLFGGSIVVERIFSIPGMGLLALDAVMNRDFNMVMASTLIGGMMGLFFTLVADLGYALADPRVSYE